MLTPRKRITKKELKEDKLVTLYAKGRDWIEENFKMVVGASAIILLIVVGALFISSNKEKSEAMASVKLAKAITAFDSNDYSTAISAFSDIVENNGSTKSGSIARLYLAQSLFRTNEFVGAEEHFKSAASKLGGDIHLKTTALSGVAASLEQQGKFQTAGEKYVSIVDKNPEAPMASYYLLRAARCFEKTEDSSKAFALYEKLIKDYPDSQEKDDALLLNAMH
jgi:predicted negative regulator of RcsB-dependent stress response